VRSLSRSQYFSAWLIFTLCGTLAGNFAAVVVTSAVLPAFDMAGASEQVSWWVKTTLHFIVALSVSYVVFCYVVRTRVLQKADAEATPTI
jgi:hypothetical protein